MKVFFWMAIIAIVVGILYLAANDGLPERGPCSVEGDTGRTECR